MAGGEGTTLIDLEVAVRDWYQRRIRSFLKRTLNQGLGPFLVFAITLTLAALATRLVWVGGSEDQAYVARLMTAKIQPQTEATRATVLSLLLAALEDSEVSPDLYCNGRQIGDCALGRNLWLRTQALLDATEHGVDGAFPTTTASAAQQWPFDLDMQRALRTNSEQRRRILDTEMRPAEPCGNPDQIAARAATFDLPIPRCTGTRASRTVEVVPYLAADALDPAMGQVAASAAETTNGDTTSVNAVPSATHGLRIRDYRVRRARLDGDLFDLAVASMEKRLEAAAVPEKQTGPEVVAAYFISMDSVIRYWTRMRDTQVQDLTPHRLWAARPYFEPLLSDMQINEPITTRAYMDFLGHGIVYTECNPVRAKAWSFSGSTLAHQAGPTSQQTLQTSRMRDSSIVVGAVCTDYALRTQGLKRLIASVDAGPLADATAVSFWSGPGGEWRPDLSALPRWAGTSELRAALVEAAKDLRGNSGRRREILPLGSDANPRKKGAAIFLIPAHVRADGRLDAIVLRVSGLGPLGSRGKELALATICGGIALAALLAAFRGSRAVAKRERLLGRLRNLQVAVYQTDGQDFITAANDRAEDLIGRSLPKFGIEERNLPKMSEIFDLSSVLCVRSDSCLRPVPERPETLGSMERGDPEAILTDRMFGETSTYYVRLRSPRTIDEPEWKLSRHWVRVTSGPVLRPSTVRSGLSLVGNKPPRDPLHATFGVIEPVPSTLEEHLERSRQHQRNVWTG